MANGLFGSGVSWLHHESRSSNIYGREPNEFGSSEKIFRHSGQLQQATALTEAFLFNLEQMRFVRDFLSLLGSLILLWRCYTCSISISSEIPLFGFEFDRLILRLPTLV